MHESENILSLQRRIKVVLASLEAKNNNLLFSFFFRKKLQFFRNELTDIFQILLIRIEFAEITSKKFDELIKELNEMIEMIQPQKPDKITMIPGYICQVQIPPERDC